MTDIFHRIAVRVSNVVGSSKAFLLALTIIIVWAVTGPIFDFSDTWQLIINTATTIVTFLMVFLIQNTQNRDSKVMQLKLDELIKANSSARDTLIDLEDMTDEELAELDKEFRTLHEKQAAGKLMVRLHAQIKAEQDRRHKRHPLFKKLLSRLKD